MATIARRDFLKVLGAAGAAGAGLALLSGQSIAQAGPTGFAGAGRVVINKTGPATIHSYIAPDYSFLVTSHLIETASSLVMIDAQFLQSAAAEVLAYAESLGKPLNRIILSHAHPDHWSGANLFPDVPFVSTDAVAAGVQADIDGGGVQARIGMVGEAEVPATPRVPDGGLLAGEETIDGVAFAYEVFNDAEAPEQVVVRLPESGVVIVQDYVYNNAHFFPLGNIPNWIAQLEAMRGLSADGYRTLLPGHGLPTSLGEIDIAIEYLTLLDETLQASDSAEAVIAAMSAAYPGFEGAGILGFAASLYTQG